METDAEEEIRAFRGFPLQLGKAFGFPTVPTGLRLFFLLTLKQKRTAMIHLKQADFLS